MKYLSSLEAYCIVGGQNVDDNEEDNEEDSGYTFTYIQRSRGITAEDIRSGRNKGPNPK